MECSPAKSLTSSNIGTRSSDLKSVAQNGRERSCHDSNLLPQRQKKKHKGGKRKAKTLELTNETPNRRGITVYFRLDLSDFWTWKKLLHSRPGGDYTPLRFFFFRNFAEVLLLIVFA